MLRVVIPIEREWVWVAIDGVGYGDHLVQVRRQACELGQVGLVHGAGGFAVMQVRAAGVVVQRTDAADRTRVCTAARTPGLRGCVAL